MELQTHPKVVRILSATSSDKFRVIGGLHAVWCVFDQHSQDGKLFGYTPDLLDHVIGFNGFSAAMVSVDWLIFDGVETLSIPEFTEHNGQSAKRRAEDQKRKKESRKCPQNVRTESEDDADKQRTREEKRRVNKQAEIVAIPDCVSEDVWEQWINYRKERKLTCTKTTLVAQLKNLQEWSAEGFTSDSIITESIAQGWQGLFKPKTAPKATVHQMPSIFDGAI